MAKLTGLASFVSELRAERTNLVDRLRHVDAALSVLSPQQGQFPREAEAHHVGCRSQEDQLAQKARWAKAKGRAPNTSAHFSSRQKEDRSRSTGEVGDDSEESGCLTAR